jgi:colanic acid biosynthesis glycosyl transferase WcaI
MANILILSLVFSPDGVSTAALVSELAHELQSHGHEMTVLTTQPHYNIDVVARSKQPLTRRWGGLFYQSVYHEIPIWHVAMRPKGERVLVRILDFIFFHIVSILLGILGTGRQDVVFAVSPPLSIGIVGWLLAVFKKAKFIYNVQELYPDTAVKSGFLREGTLIVRLFERMAMFIYKRASALTVICNAFAEAITSKRIDPDKIMVIPNFVDTENTSPGSKNNSLAAELGLVDKFVVLYAGNIGMLQSLDTLLEVASTLQFETNIAFLIVGDGAQRSHIEAQIHEQKLNNVTLMPYQSRSHMPVIYATADICLVPLMAGTAQTVAPSKLFVIMANGCPALVAVDADSDLAQIVENAQCGIAVAPDNTDALRAGIQHAYENQELMRNYGNNGRLYAEKNFARKVIGIQYHNLIQNLVTR